MTDWGTQGETELEKRGGANQGRGQGLHKQQRGWCELSTLDFDFHFLWRAPALPRSSYFLIILWLIATGGMLYLPGETCRRNSYMYVIDRSDM